MFELCTVVGCPHPDYLQNYLTSTQIAEWEAYNRISPIGEKRLDFHIAHLISTITNIAINVHGKKNAKQVKLEDFIPDWVGDKQTPMTPQEMKERFLSALKGSNDIVNKQQ
jgi:hypothetical protein